VRGSRDEQVVYFDRHRDALILAEGRFTSERYWARTGLNWSGEGALERDLNHLSGLIRKRSMSFLSRLKTRLIRDEVSTIRVSEWILKSAYIDSLSHPLTQMVLTRRCGSVIFAASQT